MLRSRCMWRGADVQVLRCTGADMEVLVQVQVPPVMCRRKCRCSGAEVPRCPAAVQCPAVQLSRCPGVVQVQRCIGAELGVYRCRYGVAVRCRVSRCRAGGYERTKD